jgi:NADP-dependent 3-hydroxy acid dehydrogenase YdfG
MSRVAIVTGSSSGIGAAVFVDGSLHVTPPR